MERQKAILVSAQTGQWDVEHSLSELRALCDTDGIDVAAEVVQTMERLNPATYIGSGKALEVQQLAEQTEADLVIVDDDSQPGGDVPYSGDRPHSPDPGYFCPKCRDGRGKASGGAGSAEIQTPQIAGTGEQSFPAGRRNRDQRTRRDKAGDGPPAYPVKDTGAERKTGGSGETS